MKVSGVRGRRGLISYNQEKHPMLANALTDSSGHLRLWHPATNEFLWSNHSEPPEKRRPLLDVLAERDGWTLATFDFPGRGRVWVGRIRIGDNGDIEARSESEFLTAMLQWPNSPVVGG